MKPAKATEPLADFAALSEPQELLRAFLNTSAVGLGICDQQLRFRAVNKALATMNGVAAQAHLGKTIRDVLGEAAAAFEAPTRHVFSTGRDVSNHEVSAKLSKRAEVGCWIGNYFPLKDAAGGVKLVGAVVLEITEQRKLQQLLCGVTHNLIQNLLSVAHDSDALLRQVGNAFPAQIRDVASCRNRSAAMASPNQGPFCSLQSMPKVLEGCSENGANATVCAGTLTHREWEVLKLRAEGNNNKETATILGISVKTVETHRARIMLKLGLHSTRELVHYAIHNKMLDPVG